jgi:hypothetical protein
MKKLFLAAACVLVTVTVISCKKDNAILPGNVKVKYNNALQDTPYLPVAGNVQDTPYIANPTVIADTPYIK